MLSTIGRAAVRRLASKPIVTSSVVSRLASRAAADQSGCGWLVSSFARSCALRSFATHAEVTKTTKTTTRKRATTTAGAKPKKAVAAAKPKKKKKVVKKKATRARGQKKKPTGRPKKKLTQEEQDKLQSRELKKTSLYLQEPKNAAPANAWLLFLSEHLKGAKFNAPAATCNRYKELAIEWKSVSSTELARLKSVADENKLKNAALHKAWIERHTPAQIREANLARHLLKRKFDYPKHPKQKRLIKDDRQPEGMLTSYTYYTKARWASGDFNNTSVIEAAKSISAEWNALSDSEKEPYVELAKADAHRFHKEFEAVNS